jgi:hypothetical protein
MAGAALATRLRRGLRLTTLCGALCGPGVIDAHAQTRADAQRARSRNAIDTIQIRRENVFDRAESDSWLARTMNGLHIVTREWVIARELLIREGEAYDSATAAETERNLRKLGIFREVQVDSVRSDSALVARVATHDAWTTQVNATFKAGGDQITWGVGLTEKNLLGSQIKGSVKYTSDPDRSTTRFGVILPRLVRSVVGVALSYDELSDGERSRLLASAPFTSVLTPRAVELDLQYNDLRVLQFFEGEPEPRDTLRHLLTKLRAALGWASRASRDRYVRLHTTLQLRNEDFTAGPITADERSFFGEMELSVEASRQRFREVRGYENLGGPEDIDLSRTVRAGVWLAPSAWGYPRAGIGPVLFAQAGTTFRRGFAKAEIQAASLFDREGLDSGSVTARVVLALQPSPRHSLALNADVGWQEDPFPGAEFDLGLDVGPRGFPLHAFTGDRMFFVTGEYRWVADPDLFSLAAVGVAAFVDYGGAWYAGSRRRTGTDVGIGLRLGSIRSSSGKGATRVDLARRFANDVLEDDWVIAVGTGFPFGTRR